MVVRFNFSNYNPLQLSSLTAEDALTGLEITSIYRHLDIDDYNGFDVIADMYLPVRDATLYMFLTSRTNMPFAMWMPDELL